MKYLSLFVAAIVSGLLLLPSEGVAASSIKVKEQQFQEDKIDVQYPQFDGIADSYVQNKINMDIKVAVDKFVAECKKNERSVEAKSKYQVHYLGEDAISFELLTYTYTGGAHGMTYVAGYTYDLKTGDKYTLTQLFDFKPSEISAAVAKHAKENSVPLYEKFNGIREYPHNFYLMDKNTPVLLFQQYEVAPYSSGVFRVKMG